MVAQSCHDSHLRQAVFDTLTELRAFGVLVKVALQSLSGPRHIRAHLQRAGGIGDDGEMPQGQHLDYEQASSCNIAACSWTFCMHHSAAHLMHRSGTDEGMLWVAGDV